MYSWYNATISVNDAFRAGHRVFPSLRHMTVNRVIPRAGDRLPLELESYTLKPHMGTKLGFRPTLPGLPDTLPATLQVLQIKMLDT